MKYMKGGIMVKEDDKKTKNNNHKIVLDNRNSLEITGVMNVNKFDEEEILLETNLGQLNINGQEMNINHLNLEKEEALITGKVSGLIYNDEKSKDNNKKGLIKRIFK